jgi:hypothetical protein
MAPDPTSIFPPDRFLYVNLVVKEAPKHSFILIFYALLYSIICHLSDFTVSEDDGIKPRTPATLVLAVRLSNHWAKSHPFLSVEFSEKNVRIRWDVIEGLE